LSEEKRLTMDAKQKDGFCSSCPDSLMEWEEVVPSSSALLMIENESQASDCCEDQNVESDWCKALLCRRCGAVALLEREPKGPAAPPNIWLKQRQGWLLTENYHHRWLQAVLNNVIFYLEEPPDKALGEVDFGLPHPSDQVWLCWAQGAPVGFCVIKLKDKKVPGAPGTRYGMNIVSAVFVRRSHRRQGLARKLLEKIFFEHQGNLGFSLPISTGMKQLLAEQMDGNQAHRREEVWGCQSAGESGDRRNLWWTFRNEH